MARKEIIGERRNSVYAPFCAQRVTHRFASQPVSGGDFPYNNRGRKA